jgi:hypothetical protein
MGTMMIFVDGGSIFSTLMPKAAAAALVFAARIINVSVTRVASVASKAAMVASTLTLAALTLSVIDDEVTFSSSERVLLYACCATSSNSSKVPGMTTLNVTTVTSFVGALGGCEVDA